jgi:hypothetical protein
MHCPVAWIFESSSGQAKMAWHHIRNCWRRRRLWREESLRKRKPGESQPERRKLERRLAIAQSGISWRNIIISGAQKPARKYGGERKRAGCATALSGEALVSAHHFASYGSAYNGRKACCRKYQQKNKSRKCISHWRRRKQISWALK